MPLPSLRTRILHLAVLWLVLVSAAAALSTKAQQEPSGKSESSQDAQTTYSPQKASDSTIPHYMILHKTDAALVSEYFADTFEDQLTARLNEAVSVDDETCPGRSDAGQRRQKRPQQQLQQQSRDHLSPVPLTGDSGTAGQAGPSAGSPPQPVKQLAVPPITIESPSLLQVAVAAHRSGLVKSMLKTLASQGKPALLSLYSSHRASGRIGRRAFRDADLLTLAILSRAPLAVARALVDAGHPVSQPTASMDPLLAAAESGSLTLVKWLVRHGAPLKEEDRSHVGLEAHPLHVAGHYRHRHIVRYFLSDLSLDPNLRAKGSGDNLVHLAADRNDIPLLKMLLAIPGIDYNHKNSKDLHTPLTVAKAEGHREAEAMLLERFRLDGVDPAVESPPLPNDVEASASPWSPPVPTPAGVPGAAERLKAEL